MRYLVQVNWIGQFVKAFLLGFGSLPVLAIAIEAYEANNRIVFFLCILIAPLLFYMAVGAALNGGRAFGATFKVRYGWGRDK